jgi:hypothetical protein
MTTLNQSVKTLTQRAATQAALRNEQMTRDRVKSLEEQVRRLEAAERVMRDDYAHWSGLVHKLLFRRGFWGRLKWLLVGR